MGQFVAREHLRTHLDKLRKGGARIVFTNGCFDLLHRGHVEYLKKAKSFGDVLVVGVNTDASVRRLKGEGRPYVGEEDRAEVLAALQCVDFVCLFDEDTPKELVKEVKPHVLVKGRDYESSIVVGADDVLAWGGDVRLIELVPGRSTTELAERVARARGKGKK